MRNVTAANVREKFRTIHLRCSLIAPRRKGFVWRFQTEAGDATYLRPFDDKRIHFNMSVWETVEDLKNYV